MRYFPARYHLHHRHGADRDPQLDADPLSTWVAERHAQIEQGTLVYIAHQLDVLGRVPVRMGEREVSKP